MDDLISRQAAIAAADRADYTGLAVEDVKAVTDEVVKELKKLPSAKMQGKWIPEFNGKFKGGSYWFHCSHCKRIVPDVRNGGWNYCPNCGADMRG